MCCLTGLVGGQIIASKQVVVCPAPEILNTYVYILNAYVYYHSCMYMGWQILYKESFNLKLSGNDVYYTA